MATRVRQELVDDVDGSDAVETIGFTFEGVIYEIDVNESHGKELRKDFEKWVRHARRTGGTKKKGAPVASNGGTKGEMKKIRTWAIEQQYDVGAYGRLPQDVIDAYHAAQAG